MKPFPAAPLPDYDLVVVGGTAPGLVAAIRAAREGLTVALVATGAHLGGSLPSLGAAETHYRGKRAPLLREFLDRIRRHYRAQPDPHAARVCEGGSMVTFEPHVAERVLEQMVAGEPRLQVFRGYRTEAVETEGRRIRAVRFVASYSGGAPIRLQADAWIEAGYEGDFLALAGVTCRVGRESRREFGEPRAGRVFTRWLTGTYPRAAVEGRLNLVTARATTSEPLPGSTGEGDDAIQSYSYRLCLTDDPANRWIPESPPATYDRARFAPILLDPAEKEKLRLPFHHRFLIHSLRDMIASDHLFHGHALPNRKRSWNATNLTGGSQDYPLASPERRREIEAAHRDHAMGLLYFLQNDPAMPEDIRHLARQWGLARDEFADNGFIPHQIYVREARRMIGRAIFTERDALIADGQQRAPIHRDSIGITEFSLDSLACTPERMDGSLGDGQLFQMEVSRPGQVPFGVLLAREWDNLLAVTTVSATHVAWGSIRQTPTLMHLAESAAWAVILANRQAVAPAHLPVNDLQTTLVSAGVMITFFNDSDLREPNALTQALQLLGTRGYFESYDARPEAPLTVSQARDWLHRLTGRNFPSGSSIERTEPIPRRVFADWLERLVSIESLPHLLDERSGPMDNAPLTRGEAAQWICPLLNPPVRLHASPAPQIA